MRIASFPDMSTMAATAAPTFPRDDALDGTPGLIREGYLFVSNRCRRLGSDAFETRLMLQRVTCALGADAARMFYHPERFTRVGALPPTTLRLLQDLGSVATLDAEAHRHRKRMFLSILTPESNRRLADLVAQEWRRQLPKWESAGRVVLHEAVEGVLCRAVCAWAGIPLSESEAQVRTREFAAMIDGAGSNILRAARGLILRRRTEHWVKGIVERIRAGAPDAEGSPAHIVATHRDPAGNLLDADTAAVELINLLRPTVAVANFVTFAALALHQYPQCRERLREGGGEYAAWFAQEVRRFYPFFPFVAGRAREAFEWRGRRFKPGAWVILDLYGTNHDPRLWEGPEEFRPERFAGREVTPFDFVPQGGGDYAVNHRCPGEPATVEILKTSVRLLTEEMRYEVPDQNLRVNLSRMPALPASRFVITNVRR